MDQWLNSLPRGLIATAAIAIGIGLIFVFMPLHTPCMSQNELMKKELSPLFFTSPNPKLQNKKPPSGYDQRRSKCLKGTTQGACLSWVESLETLNNALVSSPTECVAAAASLPEVKSALQDGLEMMVRLAWGPQPPKSIYEKSSWFDSYHLGTFCDLKSWHVLVNGDDDWASLREELLTGLPNSDGLTRDEIWKRSILSTNCQANIQ